MSNNKTRSRDNEPDKRRAKRKKTDNFIIDHDVMMADDKLIKPNKNGEDKSENNNNDNNSVVGVSQKAGSKPHVKASRERAAADNGWTKDNVERLLDVATQLVEGQNEQNELMGRIAEGLENMRETFEGIEVQCHGLDTTLEEMSQFFQTGKATKKGLAHFSEMVAKTWNRGTSTKSESQSSLHHVEVANEVDDFYADTPNEVNELYEKTNKSKDGEPLGEKEAEGQSIEDEDEDV